MNKELIKHIKTLNKKWGIKWQRKKNLKTKSKSVRIW